MRGWESRNSLNYVGGFTLAFGTPEAFLPYSIDLRRRRALKRLEFCSAFTVEGRSLVFFNSNLSLLSLPSIGLLLSLKDV